MQMAQGDRGWVLSGWRGEMEELFPPEGWAYQINSTDCSMEALGKYSVWQFSLSKPA